MDCETGFARIDHHGGASVGARTLAIRGAVKAERELESGGYEEATGGEEVGGMSERMY